MDLLDQYLARDLARERDRTLTRTRELDLRERQRAAASGTAGVHPPVIAVEPVRAPRWLRVRALLHLGARPAGH